MALQQLRYIWLIVHLLLGLAWIAVLSIAAQQESVVSFSAQQLVQMLVWAGWLPTIATACWQVNRRHWKALLFSDLLTSGVVVGIAGSAYIPLFLFNVVWFLPFALLPRGCITEVLMRSTKPR